MSSLRRNIAALYVLQLMSYVVPLVTLPWLTRVLGPQEFGRLGFCTAFNSYFVLLTNYGFNLSATGQIAAHRDDPAQASRIFWVTFWAQALLAALGLAILLTLSSLIAALVHERLLLLIGYAAVVGAVLTPTWYLQGVERLQLLSTISIVVRVASIPATILLVRQSSDVFAAMAIGAGPPVIIGTICLCFLLRRSGPIAYVRVAFADVIDAFRDGWHLFVSAAAMNLYTATNAVLLGFVSGSASVGYYSAAERVVNAVQGLMSPITQSAYPRINRSIAAAPAETFGFIRNLLALLCGIALVMSLLLFALAPEIVRILYGTRFLPSIEVLRWLSFLPLAIALSNVMGMQTMLPLGMKRPFTRILVGAGLLNVLMLIALARTYGATGAAAAVLATECLVAALMTWCVLSRRETTIPAAARGLEIS